jgi:hypothetical protein
MKEKEDEKYTKKRSSPSETATNSC